MTNDTVKTINCPFCDSLLQINEEENAKCPYCGALVSYKFLINHVTNFQTSDVTDCKLCSLMATNKNTAT